MAKQAAPTWSQGRTSGILFGNLRPVPFEEGIDPPARACFNCHEQGHNRSKCPYDVIPGDFCHNCGRLEVLMSTCPRCKDGYVDWAKSRDLARVAAWERAAIMDANARVAAGSEVGVLIDLNSTPDRIETPAASLTSEKPAILDLPVPVPPVPSYFSFCLPPGAVLTIKMVKEQLNGLKTVPDRRAFFIKRIQTLLEEAKASG